MRPLALTWAAGYARPRMGTDAIHPSRRLALAQRVRSPLALTRAAGYTRPRMGTDAIHPSRRLALAHRLVSSPLALTWAAGYARPRMGTDAIHPSRRLPVTQQANGLPVGSSLTNRATAVRSAAVLSATPPIRVAHCRHASVLPAADHLGRLRHASARLTADPVGRKFQQSTEHGVAGSEKNMGHLLTREEEPKWFLNSFR